MNTLANNHMSFLLRVCSSNFAHKFFYLFPEVYQKSQHFGTFLTPTSYSNSFEFNSNEFQSKLGTCPFILFLDQDHFCESSKIIPMPSFHPNLLFLFLLFSVFFLNGKREIFRERGGLHPWPGLHHCPPGPPSLQRWPLRPSSAPLQSLTLGPTSPLATLSRPHPLVPCRRQSPSSFSRSHRAREPCARSFSLARCLHSARSPSSLVSFPCSCAREERESRARSPPSRHGRGRRPLLPLPRLCTAVLHGRCRPSSEDRRSTPSPWPEAAPRLLLVSQPPASPLLPHPRCRQARRRAITSASPALTLPARSPRPVRLLHILPPCRHGREGRARPPHRVARAAGHHSLPASSLLEDLQQPRMATPPMELRRWDSSLPASLPSLAPTSRLPVLPRPCDDLLCFDHRHP